MKQSTLIPFDKALSLSSDNDIQMKSIKSPVSKILDNQQ